MPSSPASGGQWHWPAEWTRQECCWLGWPDRPDWYPYNAKEAQQAVVGVISAISAFQPVVVLVKPSQVGNAKAMLPRATISIFVLEHETPYIRDTAPLFVCSAQQTNGEFELAGVDFGFNIYGAKQGSDGKWYSKWGALYADKLYDADVAKTILDGLRIPRLASSMVLEGGSIHTDGEGTLVTTAECLLHENRNPHLTQQQIETELARLLGVQMVIWLPRGLYADWATNGHVDNFCCFVRPGCVLLAWTDDESDPQCEISQEAFRVLSTTIDAKGRRLEIHKVHLPPPLHITKAEAENREVKGPMKRNAGDRLPASYINFYRGNGCAIVPAFGEATDDLARDAIQQAYGAAVKVVSVPARPIVLGGGNIHCMTMQQAALASDGPHAQPQNGKACC